MATNKASNNIVAAILVITLVLTVAAMAINLQSIIMPAQGVPSGDTGHVNLYVEQKAAPSSTAGTVALIVK